MLLLAFFLLAAPPPDLAATAAPGLAAIRPDALSAHVRFLADDLLEGRGTGTRGHAIAARYVATRLQSLGYAPAGDKQTYFQRVPFFGMSVQPAQSAFELDGAALRFGEEVIFFPRAGSASDDVSGELVFAGYGVRAPEYGYDDVPKDLKGKIAVVLFGAPRSDRPDFFPTAASAVYSDGWRKARLLAERGAVGVVTVLTPEMTKHLPFSFAAKQAAFEAMIHREGNKPGSGSALPSARVPPELLGRLFAKSGHDAAHVFVDGLAGKLRPFPLGVRGRLRVSAALRQFDSENVVAVLRGGERANEYVALTAHLDHLGIGAPVGGDSIYNGASDNASGVSAVLEIARAFAALPQRPPRSILIAIVTAEEKGLQGSDYFAGHPTVPIDSIVANVNIDGVGWSSEPFDIIAAGAENSTLSRAVGAALPILGFKESPDPEPEQVFFIRSDQYSFVKRGIPCVNPASGWLDGDGKTEKRKAEDEWQTKNRYHQPGDEWDPAGNYEFMAKEVRVDFLISLAIALDPERPRWNPGDVFEKLFGRRGN